MSRSGERKKKKHKKKSDERSKRHGKRKRDVKQDRGRSSSSSSSKRSSKSSSNSNQIRRQNSSRHVNDNSRDSSRTNRSGKRNTDKDEPTRRSERSQSPRPKKRSPSQPKYARSLSSSPPRSISPARKRWSPSPSPTASLRGGSPESCRRRSRSYRSTSISSRGQPTPRTERERGGRESRREEVNLPSQEKPKKRSSRRKSSPSPSQRPSRRARSRSHDRPPVTTIDAAALDTTIDNAGAARTSRRQDTSPVDSDHAEKKGAQQAQQQRHLNGSGSHREAEKEVPRQSDGEQGGRVKSSPLPQPPTPKSSTKSSVKKSYTSKKAKREDSTKKQQLLSFGDDFVDEGESSQQAEFQGLRAATINEFKRHKKTSQADTVATSNPNIADTAEEAPSVTDRLGALLKKKRNAVLGPSKTTTAESRGQREYQEDRHVVVSCLHSPDDAHSKFEACPPCFFAVYDGHNGNLASEIAKSKLHTYVAKAAPTTGLRGEPPELLEGLMRAAFASTEAEILKETDADGGRQDGTTVTACLLVGDLLVTANVGDSGAVLGRVGHDGKLRCRSVSSDHKPEDPAEKRRIEAAGGEVVFNGCHRVQHNNVGCRLAVSRSLGDSQFKGIGGQPRGKDAPPNTRGQLVSAEPSVKSVRLEPHDRIVIVASDGLWDVMTGLEAVEIALTAHGRVPSNTGRAPSWADALTNGVVGESAEADPANALVKEAVKRGTADNVTAIAVVLPWD